MCLTVLWRVLFGSRQLQTSEGPVCRPHSYVRGEVDLSGELQEAGGGVRMGLGQLAEVFAGPQSSGEFMFCAGYTWKCNGDAH